MLALGGSDKSHGQTTGHGQLEPGSTQHMCRRPLEADKVIKLYFARQLLGALNISTKDQNVHKQGIFSIIR